MNRNRTHYVLKNFGNEARTFRGETKGRILIVDEEGARYGNLLAAHLPGCLFAVETCPDAATRYFLSTSVDLVILSHSRTCPYFDLLSAFKTMRPSISIIITTSCGSEELAVQAFRHGAIDYFRKPLALEEMVLSIRAVLGIRQKFRNCGKMLPTGGLQRALRYMGTNFHMPIKLEKAAREAGMSISCFERYLKNQTGMTFTAYLNGLRITRAKELLQADNAPMLQIALACGFGNQSHFNRVFKKITGTTPGAFRKADFSSN